MDDLDQIIKLVKHDNLMDAMRIAGLNASDTLNDEFVSAVRFIEQAKILLEKGRHVQAAHPLLSALNILKGSKNEKMLFEIGTLCKLCMGMSRLYAGDTYAAKEIFDDAVNDLDGVAFVDDNYKAIAYSIKAAGYMALYKRYLVIGEIEKANGAAAEAEEVYRDMQKLNVRGSAVRDNMKIEMNSVRVEVAINGAMQKLACLDFDSAQTLLKDVSGSCDELSNLINKLSDSSILFVLRASLSLYDAFLDLCAVLKKVIEKKMFFDRRDLLAIERIGKQLHDARTNATRASERGKLYFFTINHLEEYNRNLTAIGNAGNGDFGRYSGAISLAAFFVCCMVLYFIAGPVWFSDRYNFLIVVFLSLIVGFGYGAVRFKSLFSQVANKKKDGR